eukprot:15371194-Alexandrium_andersonii.AAC.1
MRSTDTLASAAAAPIASPGSSAACINWRLHEPLGRTQALGWPNQSLGRGRSGACIKGLPCEPRDGPKRSGGARVIR